MPMKKVNFLIKPQFPTGPHNIVPCRLWLPIGHSRDTLDPLVSKHCDAESRDCSERITKIMA